MTERILVCPFEPQLFSRFKNHAVVVRIDDPSSVRQARDLAEARNRLHCIWLDSTVPLAGLALAPQLKGIPIAAFVPEVGELEALWERLPLLQELRIRVYLPAAKATALRDARILSSLGIATALILDGGRMDWDALEDLLAYSAFGKLPHAGIEPFGYVMAHYDEKNVVDFGRVYFDDPSRYLHVDAEGRVALSAADLRGGAFIGDLDSLDVMARSSDTDDPRVRADHFFHQENGCAYCGAFRVCLGKFSAQRVANPGCTQLFSRSMDVAESAREREKDAGVLWQP